MDLSEIRRHAELMAEVDLYFVDQEANAGLDILEPNAQEPLPVSGTRVANIMDLNSESDYLIIPGGEEGASNYEIIVRLSASEDAPDLHMANRVYTFSARSLGQEPNYEVLGIWQMLEQAIGSTLVYLMNSFHQEDQIQLSINHQDFNSSVVSGLYRLTQENIGRIICDILGQMVLLSQSQNRIGSLDQFFFEFTFVQPLHGNGNARYSPDLETLKQCKVFDPLYTNKASACFIPVNTQKNCFLASFILTSCVVEYIRCVENKVFPSKMKKKQFANMLKTILSQEDHERFARDALNKCGASYLLDVQNLVGSGSLELMERISLHFNVQISVYTLKPTLERTLMFPAEFCADMKQICLLREQVPSSKPIPEYHYSGITCASQIMSSLQRTICESCGKTVPKSNKTHTCFNLLGSQVQCVHCKRLIISEKQSRALGFRQRGQYCVSEERVFGRNICDLCCNKGNNKVCNFLHERTCKRNFVKCTKCSRKISVYKVKLEHGDKKDMCWDFLCCDTGSSKMFCSICSIICERTSHQCYIKPLKRLYYENLVMALYLFAPLRPQGTCVVGAALVYPEQRGEERVFRARIFSHNQDCEPIYVSVMDGEEKTTSQLLCPQKMSVAPVEVNAFPEEAKIHHNKPKLLPKTIHEYVVLQKVIDVITRNAFFHKSVIMLQEGRRALALIAAYLIETGIQFEHINSHSGNGFLRLTISGCCIRMADITSFVKSSTAATDCGPKKFFFPVKLYQRHVDSVTRLPDRKYYALDGLTDEEKVSFDKYWLAKAHKPFIYEEELRTWCLLQAINLRRICHRVRLAFFKLEQAIAKRCPPVRGLIVGKGKILCYASNGSSNMELVQPSAIDPFSKHCLTTSGYCTLALLKYVVPFNLEIPILSEKPLAGQGLCSKAEVEFVRYLTSSYPRFRRTQLYSGISTLKQKWFRFKSSKYSVDFFDPVSGVVQEFLGCFIHGCPDCYKHGSKGPGGELHSHLFQRTLARINLIRTHSEVKLVYYTWECQWEKKKKVENITGDVSTQPDLDLRLSFKSGYVDTGCVSVDLECLRKASQACFGSSHEGLITTLDINSAYGSIFLPPGQGLSLDNKSRPKMPIGPPTFLKSRDCRYKCEAECSLECVKHCHHTRWASVPGFACVQIRPPSNIEFPILRHNVATVNGTKSSATLCNSCSKRNSDLKFKPCLCPNPDRDLIGTWVFCELAYAIEVQKYELIHVFELVFWPKYSFEIFQDVLGAAASIKLSCKVNTEKLALPVYAKQLSEDTGFMFKPQDLNQGDLVLLDISRAFITNFAGKNGQKKSPSFTKFVHNYSTLRELTSNTDLQVEQYNVLSQSTAMLKCTTKSNAADIKTLNTRGCLAYASITTAFVRVYMVSKLQECKENLYQTLHVNTDSISLVPIHPKARPLSEIFHISRKIGSWKVEQKAIAYTSFGSRSTAWIGRTSSETSVKFSGINTSSIDLSNAVTKASLMKEICDTLAGCQTSKTKLLVKQQRTFLKKELGLQAVRDVGDYFSNFKVTDYKKYVAKSDFIKTGFKCSQQCASLTLNLSPSKATVNATNEQVQKIPPLVIQQTVKLGCIVRCLPFGYITETNCDMFTEQINKIIQESLKDY